MKYHHNTIQRETTRQELDTKVKNALGNIKGRRIEKALAEDGDSHNVKTIAASMKRTGLTPAARNFMFTKEQKQKMPIASNLPARHFNETAPI